MRFKKHDKIDIGDEAELEVIGLLGEGGQGKLHLVSSNGKQYALKVIKMKCLQTLGST